MKLKYRGVSYEYKVPEIAIAESEEVGKYRGATFHFHKLVKALSLPVFDLKYRGVSYHTGGSAA
ncbi:hypothetical protein N836_02885 [Leptolyngbya sp. Heron Island J]|uniref:DUF4278 domain-containing protein n=1 Tax=Leptolyngbya sp. Heron Island J TaxID=1385935 RepID=UPI0003B94B21|nr:DUF4278 domain-containing protein [Leptolyngbya sp. Heron Island J]ESA37475.1 hypothetical protein N836_02885 [Leptolyngbya sp. Heron Island J]